MEVQVTKKITVDLDVETVEYIIGEGLKEHYYSCYELWGADNDVDLDHAFKVVYNYYTGKIL